MKRLVAVLFVGMGLLGGGTSPATATVLEDFDVTFTAPKAQSGLEAGSHPFAMRTAFKLPTVEEGGGLSPAEAVRNMRFDQIPGFTGIPVATPRCSTVDFLRLSTVNNSTGCPDSSALGTTLVQIGNDTGRPVFAAPVYNLRPSPGLAARLGFQISGVPVTIAIGINESPPYNVVASLRNTPQELEVFSADLTLWGTPADSVHDPYRGHCLDVVPDLDGELVSTGICHADIPEIPFLVMPRACQGPLTTLWEADSWQRPGAFDRGSVVTHDDAGNPRGMSNCGKLGFAPEITAQPTAHSAESASGLDVSVDIKDEGLTNPTGIANSDIKKAVVTLPEGMTINPSQAEGLGTCSEANLQGETAASAPGAGCPQAAKIGTVEVQTPLLPEETFKGALFVATPYENPFHSLIALYMTIKNPDLGVGIKLAGKVEPDPRTGQIIGTFDDLPQLPFSHFRLHFREGARSPLITPSGCGTYETKAVFTPYADPAGALPKSSSFTISSGVGGGPCPPPGPPPFEPGFEAGSIDNNAGSQSPFLMGLTRRDGDQDLTRFDAILPPGVTAKLAGVSRCSQGAIEASKARTGRAELAFASCPPNSQIGTTLAGAGVGSQLTYVPGKLYLAGPFGGAPLSVVAIVPAVAGPFDVGTVVVQEALTLDPETAEVRADGARSDPIPHILAGIPLRVRDIRVNVDRPNFTLNPTSCTPAATKATLFGSFADVFNPADDVPVTRTARYQAASCASLAFKPKLALSLKGGTQRNDHPALKAVLTPRRGDANIGRSVVTLPPSEFIDNAHIKNPCTRVQFNANSCPKGSILGTARAVTPLLDEPLEGKVYFRSNGGDRLLPDVVADLNGLVHIVLVGFVDSKNARIRTTFAAPPDAPVSKFTLTLNGGKKGLLVNNRNLCGHKLRAKIDLTGQNGRAYKTQPVIATSCKGKKHKRSGRQVRR